MKVIDLLNKIANNEEVPNKIKYNHKTYFYDYEVQDYCDFDKEYCLFSDFLNQTYGLNNCLNDEIEIIGEKEEKKIPEKLNKQHFHKKQRQLANKINEIIDCLDYLKSKGDE